MARLASYALDNSAAGKELVFSVGSTIAGATIKVYAGETLIGSATATGTTTDVTTNGTVDLTDGQHTITATQTEPDMVESDPSTGLTITVDTVAPTVESFARYYQEGDWELAPTFLDWITVTFSEDVVDDGALTLYNLSTSQGVTPGTGPVVTYDYENDTVTWDFDEWDLTANAGWHLVTIDAELLTDVAGNAMASNYEYGEEDPQNDMLLPLLGDATLDGSVDGSDYTALSTHWLSAGTWVDGDFVGASGVPGDGFVDGCDYTALSQNWLEVLSR